MGSEDGWTRMEGGGGGQHFLQIVLWKIKKYTFSFSHEMSRKKCKKKLKTLRFQLSFLLKTGCHACEEHLNDP